MKKNEPKFKVGDEIFIDVTGRNPHNIYIITRIDSRYAPVCIWCYFSPEGRELWSRPDQCRKLTKLDRALK